MSLCKVKIDSVIGKRGGGGCGKKKIFTDGVMCLYSLYFSQSLPQALFPRLLATLKEKGSTQ